MPSIPNFFRGPVKTERHSNQLHPKGVNENGIEFFSAVAGRFQHREGDDLAHTFRKGRKCELCSCHSKARYATDAGNPHPKYLA